MDWIYMLLIVFVIIDFAALATVPLILLKRLKNLKEDNNFYNRQIQNAVDILNSAAEERLLVIENKINEQLEKGFKETNETFIKVSNSLARINEAQRKIDSLNSEVISLHEILGEKKSNGYYGEVQLTTLLYSVFGENSGIYKIYHQIGDGDGDGDIKAEVMLTLPEPLGNICVDSKFPRENYNRMTAKTSTKKESGEAGDAFREDIIKYIDYISEKYIIPGKTSAHAIIFISSESVFSYLHAYSPDILNHAGEKNIWVVSPTTFMALLSTVQILVRNLKRDEYAQEISKELNFLGRNYHQYENRRTNSAGNIETVYKNIKDVAVASDKIKKKFDMALNENRDETENGAENKEPESAEILKNIEIFDKIDDIENINIIENMKWAEKNNNKKDGEKDGDDKNSANVDEIYDRR